MLYRENVYRRRPGLPGRLTHHLERPLVDQRYCGPRDIFDRRGLRAPYIEQLYVVQPTGVLSISLDELLPYRTAITDICPPDICPRASVPPSPKITTAPIDCLFLHSFISPQNVIAKTE